MGFINIKIPLETDSMQLLKLNIKNDLVTNCLCFKLKCEFTYLQLSYMLLEIVSPEIDSIYELLTGLF